MLPTLPRRLLAAAWLGLACALAPMSALAALPAGVTCKLTPTPAKSPFQKAYENGLWGQWASFDEADVQLGGLPAPDPSPKYHLLMKRPGAQPATDRPLLVFLHGFPEFSWAWEAWLQQFGAQYDSVAIDLKGYAGSSRPADVAAYDVTRLAHELDHVVDCLGYRKVIPIGHDWGASLAWTYAFTHPERTQALVVMATPHPYTFSRELAQEGSEQHQRSQYIRDIRSGKVKDLLSLATATGASGLTLTSLPFYKGARVNRLLSSVLTPQARLNAELNYYRAIRWPAPEAFPAQPTAASLQAYSVQVPTLAFWGTADTYFSPKSWDGVQAFVPQIELRALEGGDHWMDHNRPELPEQVLAFIRRVAPQP